MTTYRASSVDHWLDNPLSGCPTFVGDRAYRANPQWIDARRRYLSDWPGLSDADCTLQRIRAAYDMQRVQLTSGVSADAEAA